MDSWLQDEGCVTSWRMDRLQLQTTTTTTTTREYFLMDGMHHWWLDTSWRLLFSVVNSWILRDDCCFAKVNTNLPLHGLFLVSIASVLSVSRIVGLQGSSCKQVGLQGLIVRLRFRYTRNNLDMRLREFFWCYQIANTGYCNDVPDKFTWSFDTWHFVEGGGRLS